MQYLIILSKDTISFMISSDLFFVNALSLFCILLSESCDLVTCDLVGGVVASWLVRSSTDRTVRVRALAGDTVLCSWARHFTLTVPLSTQEYKWVPGICWGNLTSCWGVTCDGLASRPGGVEILLAASCYGNRDKLRPDEPVGSIRLHFFFFFHL